MRIQCNVLHWLEQSLLLSFGKVLWMLNSSINWEGMKDSLEFIKSTISLVGIHKFRFLLTNGADKNTVRVPAGLKNEVGWFYGRYWINSNVNLKTGGFCKLNVLCFDSQITSHCRKFLDPVDFCKLNVLSMSIILFSFIQWKVLFHVKKKKTQTQQQI